MKVLTHTAFSSCSLAILGAPWWQAILISIPMANISDIDHVKSFIVRFLRLQKIALYIMRKYRHRTITHSLLSQIVIAFLSLPVFFINSEVYLFMQVSYYTHILIDKTNKEGVYWLWPIVKKRIAFPLKKKVRIRVGSGVEIFLFIVFFSLQVGIFATGQFNLKQYLMDITGSTFKRYITAQEKYKENIEYICIVNVLVNEDKIKKNVNYTGPILSIDKERMIFLSGDKKILVKKDDVMNIDVFVDKTRKVKSEGHIRDVKKLANVNGLMFISGSITIINAPKVLLSDTYNTEYIKYQKEGEEKYKIILTYATLNEIQHLIEFDSKIQAKKRKLLMKSPQQEKENLEYQKSVFEKERDKLMRDEDGKYDETKRRDNSAVISEIEKQIIKIDQNILSLNTKILAGRDNQEDIDNLDKAEIFYDLTVFEFEVENEKKKN